MTKSRQSVTKLRLSRIIRCLVALGCIKLGIIGYGVLASHWHLFSTPEVQEIPETEIRQEISAAQEPMLPLPEALETQAPAPSPAEQEIEELPQGAKAAQLAAAAKPQRKLPGDMGYLPAPLLPAEPFNPLATGDESYYSNSLLPEPAPLGAPLAEAGVSLPEPAGNEPVANDSIWDMAELKSLPIPGLGSSQLAHAASLDMPVPTTTPTKSPFTPGEQVNPLTNQGRVLPGAPEFPKNIPAVNGDAAPLSPRQPTLGNSGPYASTPNYASPQQAPAPNITPRPTELNPNMKAQELARQQQDYLMLRQQLDQRLQDLQTTEGKVKSMLDQAKNVEDQKVKNLVQMYANMKPRTAAQALENMDERVAVRILNGMAPKQSGEILTYTNPVKTAKFTEMITRLRMGE